MGDMDFYKVPVKQLTDEKYLAQRMSDYDPVKAGNSMRVLPGSGKWLWKWRDDAFQRNR